MDRGAEKKRAMRILSIETLYENVIRLAMFARELLK